MPFIKTLSGTLINTDMITHIDLNDAADEINMVCTVHFVNNATLSFTGDLDTAKEDFDLIANELNKADLLRDW